MRSELKYLIVATWQNGEEKVIASYKERKEANRFLGSYLESLRREHAGATISVVEERVFKFGTKRKESKRDLFNN